MAAQVNIINDIGTLAKVPNKVLTEFINKESLCIGSAINDAKLAGEEVIILNIGIGTLSVSLIDMQCKFIPSKDLKTIIKRSISDNIDPLEFVLEQTFIDKLLNICDEVI